MQVSITIRYEQNIETKESESQLDYRKEKNVLMDKSQLDVVKTLVAMSKVNFENSKKLKKKTPRKNVWKVVQ